MVELGYIAIKIAITGQIIVAVSVDVDAAVEISCNPRITIAVGGYAIAPVKTATADIFDNFWLQVFINVVDVNGQVLRVTQPTGVGRLNEDAVTGLSFKVWGTVDSQLVPDNGEGSVIRISCTRYQLVGKGIPCIGVGGREGADNSVGRDVFINAVVAEIDVGFFNHYKKLPPT